MTSRPAAARLTLDPATTDETPAPRFDAQRPDPEHTAEQRQSRGEAAVESIAALRPRDPAEATHATRAAAAYDASMECFRRAMSRDAPDNVGLR